jgi:galactokinase
MQVPAPPPRLRDEFAARFGHPCTLLARAPGRVNLIGEHTDYNDGFVLPMALQQCTWVAAAPRRDGRLRAVALDLGREHEWAIDAWPAPSGETWTAYVAGVAVLLQRGGQRLDGADLLITSEVPIGGGLASSAALEVATALALGTLAGDTPSSPALADLCRAAEHEFAGVPCGLMDQYISVLARAGHALLLDCRTRTWEHVPLRLGEHVILVLDSGVRHELAGSAYAQRQQQCDDAVKYLRRLDPTISALRDVALTTIAQQAAAMPPQTARRARHVVSETERTLAAADALRRGDLAALGRLLYASHVSLRDDYEVSCHELDLLVELVRGVPGVLGARMTGGGFGGCIVALAHRESVPAIEKRLRLEYHAAGCGPAALLLAHPGPGASVESA